MSQFSNALEVFKLLNKSNCRECGEKTCLAFAGAVFTGSKPLHLCPYLPEDVHTEYKEQKQRINPVQEEFLSIIKGLKKQLATLNFEERAKVISGTCEQGKITLPIMGKPLTLDKQGLISTDLHVNSWVTIMTLHYVISCKGIPVKKNWVPLRELPGGKDWFRLFGQQCEKVLKDTADAYPDLFADLVEMFKGKEVDGQFDSDVAVILSPLPLVPMLICYWKPEDGMESSLNLFFDYTAEQNLGMEGLYTMGVGIAQMLEKMAIQHGAMR